MHLREPTLRRLIPLALIPLIAAAAGTPRGEASAPAPAAPAPNAVAPLDCDDPVTLRTLAAGLYFRGDLPSGFRPSEQGLRNPDTGEEIPVEVDTQASGADAVARVRDASIRVLNIRTTGETADGWRCAADFEIEQGDRTTRGEATYTSEVDGLEYRVSGRFSIEGVEISF